MSRPAGLRCGVKVCEVRGVLLTPTGINSGWGSETEPFKKLRKIEVLLNYIIILT